MTKLQNLIWGTKLDHLVNSKLLSLEVGEKLPWYLRLYIKLGL